MTMRLGRAAINDDPTAGSVRLSADELSFKFDLGAASVAEYQALTQQLRGLTGNADEPVVPFTWSEDPTLDGYYTDARVEVEPAAVALTTGYASATARLRRITGGFARPRVEVTTTMVTRTNSHAIAAPSPLLLFSAAEAIDRDDSAYTVTGSGLLAVDGGTNMAALETSNATSAGSKSYRYSTLAADHYIGAATVEVDYSGTFYALSGVHAPADLSDAKWRLGNGVVRCYAEWNATNANYDLVVESWNGTAWAGTNFAPSDGSVAAGGPPLFGWSTGYPAARVVRNSPEQCVLRFDSAAMTTYVSIARGQPFVVVNVTETEATPTYQMGWDPTAPGSPASTAITGGARASANDSNGRRWLVSCPSTVTFGGAVYLSVSALTSTWQLCPDYLLEITANSGLTMRNYFMAATAFHQQVVAR